jgi:fructokinase
MSATEVAGVLVGVELGGTKMVVASSADGVVLDHRAELATTDPDSTLSAVREAVVSVADGRPVEAIGIASFGPLDLRESSERFGHLVDTPKPGWSGVDVVGGVMSDFDIPFMIDTDVNAAVIAETIHGAGRGFSHVAYLTVGTGVGGGIWSNGRVLHGANHPEIGHIRVPKHPEDHHVSSCPFHADCLEGMASGTAVRERWGRSAESLEHLAPSAVRLEAWYLARGIAGMCAVVPVEVVVIGGGISKLPDLHHEITKSLEDASGMYPPIPFAEGGPGIVAPDLGDDAGVRGAIELAKNAMSESATTRG